MTNVVGAQGPLRTTHQVMSGKACFRVKEESDPLEHNLCSESLGRPRTTVPGVDTGQRWTHLSWREGAPASGRQDHQQEGRLTGGHFPLK